MLSPLRCAAARIEVWLLGPQQLLVQPWQLGDSSFRTLGLQRTQAVKRGRFLALRCAAAQIHMWLLD
jgi:hypothetical protein